MASRKRSSPAVKPLPASVAWLSDISLEMTSTNSIRAPVKFNLRMVYQPKDAAALSWDVQRSFDQYRAFQKRLLRQLQPKHSCKAECRWLYSTVKKHFPKPTLIGSHCPPLVELRRKALLQILSSVQASVLNHGNRGCKVMMEAVSNELAAFLVGDDTNGAEGVTPPVTPSTGSELDTELETPASSLRSITSSEEGEENLGTINYDEDQWVGWSLPAAGHLDLARTSSSPV
jgi:hypothetical protein